jgi:hypothetical protein
VSVAKEYLDLFHTTCVFHNWVRDAQGETVSDTVCGESAVAVYVSDDKEPMGRYVCQRHAEEAERDGDGPVFWQKRRLMPEAEEFEGLRLTLAEEEPTPRERLIAEAKRQGLNVDHLSKL